MSLYHAETPVRPTTLDSSGGTRWKRELREAIRDPWELCDYVGVPRSLVDPAAAEDFSVIVPRGFADRIAKGDPADPLLLQVLPRPLETGGPSLPEDAVGDLSACPTPGLLQKYEGRALLVATGRCAVNCRYCFRRHFPYGELPVGDREWRSALAEIERDASIREVILSGGDPLTVTDERLSRWFEQVSAIRHVERIRVHTRLPIVIPSRVTQRLCDRIDSLPQRTVVVLHVNHAQEIDADVSHAVRRLRSAGALLLNQSVLLRRVNDSSDRLAALSERLIEIGVLPYYLHQLDRVRGVDHFFVPESRGVELIGSLRDRLPGYAVPRYVREDAGSPSKTPLA